MVVVTGEVTVRLRRGEDYTILRTEGPTFSYHPDKLSMERVENGTLYGELEAGGADRITSNPAAEGDESDRVLDDVAIEVGTD